MFNKNKNYYKIMFTYFFINYYYKKMKKQVNINFILSRTIK